MFKFLIPICFVIIFPLEAFSNQFGLELGDATTSIRNKGVILKNDGGYWYRTNKLPKGNPNFNRYDLLITPVTGLCKIVAYTENISTNSFGSELKSKFDFFATALEEKYGDSKKYDFLSSGSIWSNENDWMMGLLKKERYLVNFWTKEQGSNLPSHINILSVKAKALRNDEGYIVVVYEFSNTNECFKERDKLETQNL